ncbi:MAG TPA: DinB family protein [bacterium]
MLSQTVQRLQFLCATIPALLRKISDEEFSEKPSPDKWSKKEILGHLIDSAANNHQRFLRVQFEDTPHIVYDQVNWNRYSHHRAMNTQHLISFWEIYNRHLLAIIKTITPENLQRTCRINQPEPVTLQWLIEDYVRHLGHHLRQVVDY